MSIKFISQSVLLILTSYLISSQVSIVSAHPTGTQSTGGVRMGNDSRGSSGRTVIPAKKFTCLRMSSERGGSYSLISGTGVTILSSLADYACNNAIWELNKGNATCIQLSIGSYMHPRPTYALTSVERGVISSPMEYDDCRESAYQLNAQ